MGEGGRKGNDSGLEGRNVKTSRHGPSVGKRIIRALEGSDVAIRRYRSREDALRARRIIRGNGIVAGVETMCFSSVGNVYFLMVSKRDKDAALKVLSKNKVGLGTSRAK